MGSYMDPESAKPCAQTFLRTYLSSGYPLRKLLNSIIEGASSKSKARPPAALLDGEIHTKSFHLTFPLQPRRRIFKRSHAAYASTQENR